MQALEAGQTRHSDSMNAMMQALVENRAEMASITEQKSSLAEIRAELASITEQRSSPSKPKTKDFWITENESDEDQNHPGRKAEGKGKDHMYDRDLLGKGGFNYSNVNPAHNRNQNEDSL